MGDEHWLSERFEEHRPRLRAVAYRVLGSLSEADDAVQEAWLRSIRADTSQVENLGAWLATIVGWVSLNMLRARRARPEEPIGFHLPDLVMDSAEGVSPEHETLLADAVGVALMIVLETLSPPERLAYVLHDMFGIPFTEIAPVVQRSSESTRQLASRARRRIRRLAPLDDGDLAGQRVAVAAFLAASRDGDFDALIAVLDPEVVLRAELGADRADAAIEVRGARTVAGSAQAYLRLGLLGIPVLVNGTPGVFYRQAGQPFSVLSFTVSNGLITSIDILADQDRLGQLVSRVGNSPTKSGDPDVVWQGAGGSSYRGTRNDGNAARRHLGAGISRRIFGAGH
ncbi:sigma-70 family RNA polymerase sigma factor [Pseudonocardia spinosispora]|uniref:sigma-70 family RNA polymerase sigma factor n=1 Tax=Pseudonocardia spinosispora TaxID=103441 RepID=UPI00041CB22C